MKIVVSSHIKYEIPLNILLQKLIYTKYPIIVVISNCEFEKIYTQLFCNTQVLYIETNENNYEFTAFNMIKKYIDDCRIYDESYFFIHDTCVINLKNFGSFFENNILQVDDIILCPLRSSNIMYIHSNIFRKYDYYYENISKKEACDLEANIDVRHMKSLLKYGNVKFLRPREIVGCYDIYKTGHARIITYYPDFQIYKTNLNNLYGDFIKKKLSTIYVNSKRKKRIKPHITNELLGLFENNLMI